MIQPPVQIGFPGECKRRCCIQWDVDRIYGSDFPDVCRDWFHRWCGVIIIRVEGFFFDAQNAIGVVSRPTNRVAKSLGTRKAFLVVIPHKLIQIGACYLLSNGGNELFFEHGLDIHNAFVKSTCQVSGMATKQIRHRFYRRHQFVFCFWIGKFPIQSVLHLRQCPSLFVEEAIRVGNRKHR